MCGRRWVDRSVSTRPTCARQGSRRPCAVTDAKLVPPPVYDEAEDAPGGLAPGRPVDPTSPSRTIASLTRRLVRG